MVVNTVAMIESGCDINHMWKKFWPLMWLLGDVSQDILDDILTALQEIISVGCRQIQQNQVSMYFYKLEQIIKYIYKRSSIL